MAVPGSGPISLLKIFSEKNEDDYTSNNDDGENSFSLRGLSSNANSDSSGGNINLNVHSPSSPDSNTPHKMSEFYAYDHDFTPIACNLAMDVVFLIDYTGSMTGDMDDLKTHVATITNKVVERSGGDYRLAAVLIDQGSQPTYWANATNTVVANLNSAYKYNSGNIYLAAMVPFSHSNKSDFDTKIGYLNAGANGSGSNSSTGMEIGTGSGSPEPNDTAIDRVINHDFAGAFRSGVNKMIILMTDNAPDGDGDDNFNGAEEYNKMGTLSSDAVSNNITIMICGDISDSGTYPQSVHGIYQGYATNTGGSFNSNHDPSDITGFINTICNNIESLYPSVTTKSETSVTSSGFTMNGDVANDSTNITHKGFVRSTSNVNLRKGIGGVTDTGSLGTGTAGFSSAVTGLSANTTYYYRAYATTSDGGGLTSYGDIEQVATSQLSNTAAISVYNVSQIKGVFACGQTTNDTWYFPDMSPAIGDQVYTNSSNSSTPSAGKYGYKSIGTGTTNVRFEVNSSGVITSVNSC